MLVGRHPKIREDLTGRTGDRGELGVAVTVGCVTVLVACKEMKFRVPRLLYQREVTLLSV